MSNQFTFQQIHAIDKEYSVASELLAVGVESTDDSNATYLKVLFLLSRAMILMIERKANDVLAILHQASTLIDNAISNANLKEYLKVFFLVLQVCYYLAQGQVKTVKPSLKQLQQSIQTIIAPNWPSDEGTSFAYFKFVLLTIVPRSDLRSKHIGNVYLVAEGTIVCAGVSADGFPFDDGRLHGQSIEIHGKSADTNRQIEKPREQTDFVGFPDHPVGAHSNVSHGHGQ